jgi:hypothetical protein
MSKPCWILTAAMSLLVAVTIHAQDKAAAANHNGAGGAVVGVGMAGSSGSSSGAVHGLPFSADTIYQTDQFLADGNHIHSEVHGKMFRDSEGRTRIETEVPFHGPEKLHIHISDPVENGFIDLDTEKKTALVHDFGNASANEIRPPQPTRPATAAAAIAPGALAPLTRPTALATTAAAPAATAALTKDRRDPQDSSEEAGSTDLGTMEIEGFTARGTRYIAMIPAGQLGNDKPMTNTTERWYSEDLKIELMTKSVSPQSGTHVHKLVNIRIGDPDPLLFQVPADYTVQETPQQ